MGTRRGLPALIGFLVLFAGFPLGSPQPVAAASSELFFSEYIEGSSNNKALEIYNDTGAAIDLADRRLQRPDVLSTALPQPG